MRKKRMGRMLALLLACALLHGCGGDKTAREPRFDPSYPIYAGLLQRYVDDAGWVDYTGLKADSALVAQAVLNLRAMPPDTLAQYSRQQKMAYWINAYNLLLLEEVVQNYPVDSIQDILNVLNRVHHDVAGQDVSLNDIDKAILLGQFADPRTCFALCRASVSSPILNREPYDPQRLSAQLQGVSLRFLSDTSRNVIDREAHEAIISPIFEWYRRDFNSAYHSQIPADQPEDTRAAFNFIAEILPESVGRFLREQGVTWSYMPYDWRLNDKAKAGLLSAR